VFDGCTHYDDARVGEVSELRCRVSPAGEIEFESAISLTTKFRPGNE